jgi:hypothetical protein
LDGDQPIRKVSNYTQDNTKNKCTQIFMPRVRFKPTITALERVKTVHDLDHAATVIGRVMEGVSNIALQL